jgi:hypothetical protein
MKLPEFIYRNGYVYRQSWSKYFGSGYIRQTENLRDHPKHFFVAQTQALQELMNGKSEVAINVQPHQKIIDTLKFEL